jgi:hypothetical protein
MLQVYIPNISHVSDVCCKCFVWMLHMSQTYVSIVLPCYSTLQQVLLSKHSDLRASTRCTRRPYNNRRGPPRWSMQSAQDMCMRIVLPPSFSHWGTRAVISLALGYACCDPSLSHAARVSLTLGHARCSLSLELGYTRCVPSLLHVVVLSLSHWGTRDVFPLYLSQEEAWGVATAGGGVGCSNRRRRVFPQKSKRWRGEH